MKSGNVRGFHCHSVASITEHGLQTPLISGYRIRKTMVRVIRRRQCADVCRERIEEKDRRVKKLPADLPDRIGWRIFLCSHTFLKRLCRFACYLPDATPFSFMRNETYAESILAIPAAPTNDGTSYLSAGQKAAHPASRRQARKTNGRAARASCSKRR